jgi:transposase
VWRMEDVLDLYAEPYDPTYPQVCFDERPVQLLGDAYAPIPMQKGQVRRYDYAYEREGTVNLFMMVQPLSGWRMVKTTQRRTKVDFAACMKDLVDVHFPQATRIRVVLDNLNTHNPSSLYEAFTPEEARRILRKLEFHYTPKHGSWLNMAEIEISVLSRQCLKQRLPSLPELGRHVSTWTHQRNEQAVKIKWCFNLDNARTKLARLYP